MKYSTLIAVASEAGKVSSKVATECKKHIKGLSEDEARKIPKEAYAEFLNGRKVKTISATDKRTYDSMRQGFSRVFRELFPKDKIESEITESARILAAFDTMLKRLEKVEAADLDVAKTLTILKDTRAKVNALVFK